jgi:hypothetical protein
MPVAEAEQIVVTAELLAAGRSERGGWSKAQLAILGVAWPPTTGWKAVVVGLRLPRAEAERFVSLRAGELPPEGGGLFDSLP